MTGETTHETLPGEKVLLRFTEAIHSRDPTGIEAARSEVTEELGLEAATDAAAVAAAFFGFDLVADATGCQVAEDVMTARANVHRVLGLERPQNRID